MKLVPSTRLRRACALLAVFAALTGCSSTKEVAGPKEPEATAALFNDVDVAFVVDAGAELSRSITAAQMVTSRTSNPAVEALAVRIVGTKGRQADAAARWIRSWGRQGADLAHDSAEHTREENAGGFTDEVMIRLSRLTGTEFDRLFLSSLVKHLQQSRSVWATERAGGDNAEAVALARDIGAQDEGWIASAQQLLRG